MTQEEKELLFKDLCSRLPYHPILNWKFIDNTSKDEELKELSDLYIWWITKAQDCRVRPYLRSLFSMTEEEKKEYDQIRYDPWHSHYDEQISSKMIDWLNEHHFDYRGLIEKGLALEAPEDMYDF